jgi:hypothetical protein
MIDEPKNVRTWRERIEALLARVQAMAASALSATAAFHAPVVAVATVNIALAGLAAIDGVAIVDGSRVLAANQQALPQNGIWVAHAGAWTRPSDWATGSTRVKGEQIPVAPGGVTFVNFGSNWMLTDTIVVDAAGSDPIIFPKFHKGTAALDGAGVDVLAVLWVFDATATAFATDITVGAIAPVNAVSLAAGAGDGRANGTLTLQGTAAHTVAFEVLNF